MGHFRKKIFQTQGSSRSRESRQKTSFRHRRREMQKIVKKAKSAPLSTSDLRKLTQREPNFLGIFSSDQLKSLRVLKPSVSFIVNLDVAGRKGSHWVAIRIGRKQVEVFDALGFNLRLWETYSTQLLKFLSRYIHSHRFYVTPILQPPNTFTCGLFSAFYIIKRRFLTFTKCVKLFSRDIISNNVKLFSYMDKIIT